MRGLSYFLVFSAALASICLVTKQDLSSYSARIMTFDDVPPAPSKENKIKVLYTVFAGRRNRMILQEPYWEEMYRLGQIDEVHLWNFTHGLENESSVNHEYLRHLGEKYSSFLKIMQPSDVEMNETYWYDKDHNLKGALEQFENGRAVFRFPGTTRGYTEYYKYYAENPYNGVIIKGDDDIVWINSTMVRPFAEYLWNHKEIFLLSASVVNQGLCAYYQQKHGAIPMEYQEFPFPGNGMGRLHNNATQALMLHRHFLESEENRRKFFITEPEYYPFNYTINVNFIAIRGEDFPKTFELIQDMLRSQKRYYDEGAITWHAIRTRGYQEGIYMPLVVSHSNFGVQRNELHDIISAYTDYARKERASLYGDILDDFVPPPDEVVIERQKKSKKKSIL